MKNTSLIRVVSFFSLLIFPVLFTVRSYDNNSLTSWIWVFRDGREIVTFFSLAAVIPLAYFVSGMAIPSGKRWLFLLIVPVAVAVPMWASPETIIDASRYFTQAKYLELKGAAYFISEWGNNIDAWTDMPVVPFLYGMIFRIAGEQRIFIQMFTSVLFALTVFLTYLTGRELFDEDTALTGALLLLGIPYLFTQIPLMLVDVPVMFLLLLSVYTFIRALKEGGFFRIGYSSVAVTLTLYAKYSSWVMLTVLAVIFVLFLLFPRVMLSNPVRENDDLLRGKEYSPGECLRILSIRAGGVVLVTLIFSGGVFVFWADVIREQLSLLFSYQKPGLGRWSESFVSTFLFQIHPFITAGAFFSLIRGLRNRDPRVIAVFWLVLLVFLLQIRRIRYVIMIFPMLTLMAAYGFRMLGDARVKSFLVSIIVSYSLVIAYSGYLPFVRSMSAVNLMEAGKYLDSLDEDSVRVEVAVPDDLVANPSVIVPILDYHTRKSIIFHYNDKTFDIPAKDRETSSLRFTWQYHNPAYYADTGREADNPVVVITDDIRKLNDEPPGLVPIGYSVDRSFQKNENVFRFRSLVAILRKAK